MTDNLNLIAEIKRKQAELVKDFDLLKAEDSERIADIEAMQNRQTELAAEFDQWLKENEEDNQK